MAKGGSAPYRKGAAYERRVKRELEAEGWLVTRQPASHSPYDLHAMHPNGMTFVIQCKTNGRLPKFEREVLEELGAKYNVWVMLAHSTPTEMKVLHYPTYAKETTGVYPSG